MLTIEVPSRLVITQPTWRRRQVERCLTTWATCMNMLLLLGRAAILALLYLVMLHAHHDGKRGEPSSSEVVLVPTQLRDEQVLTTKDPGPLFVGKAHPSQELSGPRIVAVAVDSDRQGLVLCLVLSDGNLL